jgi:pyrroline-5-carboxylate reductase
VLRQYEIAIIGAGNAAEGIVHAIVRNTLLFADRIVAADPNEERRELFSQRFNVTVTDDNCAAVENSDILVLAVKPQQFADVCKGFADLVREDQLIVSIMAGVCTTTIEKLFVPKKIRVVRAMPNLPIHVGEGMAAVCKGAHAQQVDLLRAQRIFEAGGRCVVCDDESQMDAVTAISGSGPAYFYYFVEALTAAAEKIGLPKQEADLLAKQTCLGAARMMIESGEPAKDLRRKVTSPGGTTQAAIESMKSNAVFDLIGTAIESAWKRSQELGR